MSVNIENPVYDVTLGLSKKDFGMQELKKVIKESGDEAGIIFATNYVEKNMDNNPLGAKELLNFANKKTKKAAKEKAKLEKEEAAKVAETQAQEQKADKYLAEYGGLEGAKAYALSVGCPQEAVDRAFDTARLSLSNNLELIKGKLFNFKKAGKGDLETIEKAKENSAKKAEKEQNEKELQVKEKNEKAIEKAKSLFIASFRKHNPTIYDEMIKASVELKNLGFNIEKLQEKWRAEQQH